MSGLPSCQVAEEGAWGSLDSRYHVNHATPGSGHTRAPGQGSRGALAWLVAAFGSHGPERSCPSRRTSRLRALGGRGLLVPLQGSPGLSGAAGNCLRWGVGPRRLLFGVGSQELQEGFMRDGMTGCGDWRHPQWPQGLA